MNTELLISIHHKLMEDLENASHGELSILLSMLNALKMMHHTAHWQAHGYVSYSDHLLFERLYTTIQEEVDEIAERAIGLGEDKLVDSLTIAKHTFLILANLFKVKQGFTPEANIRQGLEAEMLCLKYVDMLSETMKSKGTLTRGLDNLLAGIQDKHETHVYLLKQRINMM